jgi:hypothetical protein
LIPANHGLLACRNVAFSHKVNAQVALTDDGCL